MTIHSAHPLFRLPSGSVRVTDADEEIFLLYTQLASKRPPDGSSVFAGLGSVDSKSDLLSVTFELPRARSSVSRSGTVASAVSASVNELSSESSKGRKRQHGKVPKNRRKGLLSDNTQEETVELELVQDKTTLRSKKGDTGSVLWRVSVELGQLLLRQLCAEPGTSLLDKDVLARCHILELGAGTGLLGVILSPWVERYTITDLDYLVPLVRKNVTSNRSSINHIARRARANQKAATSPESKVPIPDNIYVESLDWLHIHNMVSSSRKPTWPLQAHDPIDLVIAVDCIYNQSLIPAFLDTLDYFASNRNVETEDSEVYGSRHRFARRSCVLVAVELRSEDVMREFLRQWLARDAWEVWRVDWVPEECSAGSVGTEALTEVGLEVCFAIWVGWRTEDNYS